MMYTDMMYTVTMYTVTMYTDMMYTVTMYILTVYLHYYDAICTVCFLGDGYFNPLHTSVFPIINSMKVSRFCFHREADRRAADDLMEENSKRL